MNFLLILAFAIGNLWKWSFISPDVHASVLDFVVGLMFIKKRFVPKPVWLFSLVGIISLIVNVHIYGYIPILVGGLYLLRWVVYSSVVIHAKQKILLMLGIVLIVTSLGQYLLIPDVRWLKVYNWDDHYYRVVGTFLDPGFTGILLVFTIINFTLHHKKLLWILGYLALALTYSRSSYLAFLVAMTCIAWQWRSWKFLLSILLLFLVTLAILPRASSGEGVKLERTSSVHARIVSWKTAWKIFSEQPILGVGFNTYRYAQGADLVSHAGAGADSSVLFILATTGIIGFIVYLGYLRRVPVLYLLPLLVHSLFLNSLFYPAVMIWLSLLVGASSDSQIDQPRQS